VSAVGLPLASEVADAQPPASEASANLPQALTADTSAGPQHVGNSSDSDSHSGSTSDPAVLVATAGDDLEQDSKAVLKAGGQGEVLKGGMGGVVSQQQDEEACRAQRLAFASATLSIFQRKLSGRASSQDAALPVEQHVDHLIKEATSLDNLSKMYEGWTAWI